MQSGERRALRQGTNRELTIEGTVLERSGFSGIVMDAVEKAAQKSQKLGER